MTSRWHPNKEHSIFAMFIRRTTTLWCLELIPAELESFAEAVYYVQADNSRIFFKAHDVRLENKECVMSWIDTCWTWVFRGKLFITSKRTTAEFSLRHTMFIWRTRNVWCLELIPAELESFAEAVYYVQTDNSRIFFKAHDVRLENNECVMSWIDTCWTWVFRGSCLWRPSG